MRESIRDTFFVASCSRTYVTESVKREINGTIKQSILVLYIRRNARGHIYISISGPCPTREEIEILDAVLEEFTRSG